MLLINDETSLFVDATRDINTTYGIITAKQLKNAKAGKIITTHTGKKFTVVEPSAVDLLKKIIRLPQIITPKDLGSIIMYGGINPKSKILDAGTGTGFSACVLSRAASQGKVISYEKRKDFTKVAKKNQELFGAENLRIINGDVKSNVKERNFDFALLDLPDPWEVLPIIYKFIKIGGRICIYVPSIIQIQKAVNSIPEGFKVERLIQNTENDWKVELERDILRPETSGLMHTAFLLFLRRVK